MPHVAFFDFDQTLTQRDTLLPWLIALKGKKATHLGLTRALMRTSVQHPLGLILQNLQARNHLKSHLFQDLLKDVSVADAQAAGRTLQTSTRWKDDVVAKLRWHQDQGHRVVIATGAQTLYMKDLARDIFGVEDVIGTTLEEDQGRLTGRMLGGNCVKAHKAERVQAWLDQHGPFEESWGYGNAPHDLPMLHHCTHRIVISTRLSCYQNPLHWG